jgi:hypothetical protein
MRDILILLTVFAVCISALAIMTRRELFYNVLFELPFCEPSTSTSWQQSTGPHLRDKMYTSLMWYIGDTHSEPKCQSNIRFLKVWGGNGTPTSDTIIYKNSTPVMIMNADNTYWKASTNHTISYVREAPSGIIGVNQHPYLFRLSYKYETQEKNTTTIRRCAWAKIYSTLRPSTNNSMFVARKRDNTMIWNETRYQWFAFHIMWGNDMCQRYNNNVCA